MQPLQPVWLSIAFIHFSNSCIEGLITTYDVHLIFKENAVFWETEDGHYNRYIK